MHLRLCYYNFMIQGKRIYLRHLNEHDAKRLFEYEVTNRDFFKTTSFTRNDDYYTLDNIRKNIDDYQKEIIEKSNMRFGIFLNSNHKLIGMIALNDILSSLKTSYVGYSLDLKHTHQGFMFEALTLLIDFSFTTLNLHRLEAGVMPSNRASSKVLEKCGFIREGLLRKNVHINGHWEDHYIYGLLNENDT